jgi:hypothetical protein
VKETSVAEARRLEDYPHRLSIPTRWKDNDVYGHVNNVEYYSFFDTVINTYLIQEGGLDIHAGPVIGLCVSSSCQFTAPLAFPEVVGAGSDRPLRPCLRGPGQPAPYNHSRGNP